MKQITIENPLEAIDWVKDFWSSYIYSAFFSVDTFFLLRYDMNE